jgi:hypothetical protein
MKLKSSHSIDCSNATRSDVVDFVFEDEETKASSPG